MSECLASPPPMQTFRRYWPDGSYCAEGRIHLSWMEIITTAPADQIEAFGTEETPMWCGCGVYGWIAAHPTPEPAPVAGVEGERRG